MNENKLDEAIPFFKEAKKIGFDSDWLSHNLALDYAQWAFQRFTAKQYVEAEKIYLEWLSMDPMAEPAMINLGVVYERLEDWRKAEQQYVKAAELFPHAADPVFNLSVLAWRTQDWKKVVSLLEETLRRNPQHPSAQQYLQQAKSRITS